MSHPHHFADRFIAACTRTATPLCVGLDPHLPLIPPQFRVQPELPASEATAKGVEQFLSVVLEECAGRVPVVKPQIAFFEQMGSRGIAVLERLCEQARQSGLLVLLDAKRGDIGSTASAYAASYLGPTAACRVDAITLNPYLGLDSLEPFVKAAREHGSGMFVLARTSNAGSHDFQQQQIDGTPLYVRVAQALRELAKPLVGASGWSSLGVVAGATYAAEARQLREHLPSSLFLVPGYGAQGASAGDALSGFVERGTGLWGGMVNSSRGILFGASAEPDVRAGVRARLEHAAEELGRAAGLR